MSDLPFNEEEFKAFVNKVEGKDGYERPLAFGLGIGSYQSDGTVLEVYYPRPNYNGSFGTAAVLAHCMGHKSGKNETKVLRDQDLDNIYRMFSPYWGQLGHENVEVIRQLVRLAQEAHGKKKVVVTFLHGEPGQEGEVSSVPDAYFRLHLLSHRLVRPNEVCLDGIFPKLPNNAWTSRGPMTVREAEREQFASRMRGEQLTVHSVDKFPRLTDYVIPSGVRIADASRIRLGAHLGSGTTVMHEGFCNFNAGTAGESMVEGRISAGVLVGKGSDLGGGCSTMGTLSGGGKEVISIGEKCMVGANAGAGISLGDNCKVEAGLYVTAGTIVQHNGEDRKARDLSGRSDLTFRRNSKTGVVEAIPTRSEAKLNEQLHQND